MPAYRTRCFRGRQARSQLQDLTATGRDLTTVGTENTEVDEVVEATYVAIQEGTPQGIQPVIEAATQSATPEAKPL